jgi:hypothetical protein
MIADDVDAKLPGCGQRRAASLDAQLTDLRDKDEFARCVQSSAVLQ